jgi:hypothetical protein
VCIRVKRVIPDCQGIKIRVVTPQMLKIDDPLFQKMCIGPADISGEVIHVCLRQAL